MSTQYRKTVCNRDCPDACGLVATVENGRVVKLEGDPEHAVTKGFICYRTSHFLDRHYSSERITTPLVRTGNGFSPISWDEAMQMAAERLLRIREQSGPAAILHYVSGGSLGLLKSVLSYFWELFGPVAVKRGDICSGAGDFAQETDFGEEESHDFFDILNSRNIILWGKNPTVSNIHLVPVLQEARAKGARLILVDPVRHKTEHLCHRTILPKPGGDAALAMGAAAVLLRRNGLDPEASSYCDNFDAFLALVDSRTVEQWAREADVAVEDIEIIAAALADRPCNIQVGWGMGRRTNGATIVRCLDALSAVSGNVGIPGGGVSFYYYRRRMADSSFLKKQWPRTLSEPRLGRDILESRDPPVRAVWITAGNPVAQLPDSASVAEALETRELVVVADSWMSDTAKRATLVLPVTTLLEDDDLLGAYGHHWIGVSRPVVDRPADVRSDIEIVQMLAQRIDALTGADGNGIAARLAGSARDWKRRMLSRVESSGITLERLETGPMRNPHSPTILWPHRRFPTATGKVNLLTALVPAPADEPGYPLWLFSNSNEKSQSSQWARPLVDALPARLHPEAAPGCADGEIVFIESAIGRMKAQLKFDPSQRRDLVIVPKGGHLDRGNCANALVRARLTDGGEGAAYLDCRVRIVKA